MRILRNVSISGAMLAFALSVVIPAMGSASEQEQDGPSHGQTVALVVDYGNGVKKLYTALPWASDMTVLDAMNKAKALRPALEFSHSGRGESVFVTEVDGFKNEGGGAEGRNWVYWINGQFGKKSIGVAPLHVGDVVIWRFDKWKPGQ